MKYSGSIIQEQESQLYAETELKVNTILTKIQRCKMMTQGDYKKFVVKNTVLT